MTKLRNRRLPYQRKKHPPSPELLRKRAELAQGADPVLASTPLGCCMARELIGRDAYYAGRKYGALYRRFTPRHIFPKGASLDGDMQGPPPVDEKAERRHETAYREAKKALRRAGSRATSAVENVAVFEHWPAIGSEEARTGETEALQDGLNTLARHFGLAT